MLAVSCYLKYTTSHFPVLAGFMAEHKVREEASLLLCVNLWVKVFAHLAPVPGSPALGPFFSDNRLQLCKAQTASLSLCLVLKMFREASDCQPQLTSILSLSCKFSSGSLPGLLVWTQRNAITTLYAACESSCLDVVLGGLLCCKSSLTAVFLGTVSKPAVSLLSISTALTSCYGEFIAQP